MVTFLLYHNPIKTDNITLSIDNVVLDLHISNPAARQELMLLLEKLPITHAVEVTHWNSFKIGSFKEQFIIRFQDGNSFWVGVVLNGRKPEWGRVRLDFNPNKIAHHEVFQMVLRQCLSSTRPTQRKTRRFDLAVDIRVTRQNTFLVKDSRAYLERRHGREFTQYLGAKSSTVGRVKLYNKQAEAHLDYPLTRLELTLDPSIPYEKINFPTVYYLDDLQMSFSSYKATETEQFILNALFQGCGTLDQLGRRTREKIKVLMADHVKKVEISREQYEQMVRQVKAYAGGNLQTAATIQDQPPSEGRRVPAWVQEAEASEEVLT